MMIMKAVKEDAQSILVIQKVSYIREAELYNNYEIAPLTETLDQIKEDFQKKVILKFTIEDKIIGSVRGHEKNGVCYVERLMVHPDAQKRGIGKQLMMELEKYFPTCARFDLYTGSLSFGNIRLYESIGYKSYKIEMIRENIEFVFMEKIN
ncbi:GNAT family N-acetyltransferase [Peribacillus simplex]|uniref:GNAT family N-acetyltransferase n=1 Tax=Peribacillus simplex TaxID=1478 RepID=UPI00367088D9